MLQHNSYSARGWLEVRQLLARFVRDGWTPAVARAHFKHDMDSRRRGWSLTQGPRLPGVESIAWDFTVANVRLDSPEHYCADVRRWAERVRANSQPLARAEGQTA